MSDEYKEMLERFEQICQNAKKELCGKKEKEQEKRFIEKIDKELTITEYDEIKYWLANVEVLDNTDYILNNRKAKIFVRSLKEKDQEIERLTELCNKYEEEHKTTFETWQKDIKENELLHSIIKEAREYITSRARKAGVELMPREKELLEILDKVEKVGEE